MAHLIKKSTWILWYFKMLSGVYIAELSTPGSTLQKVWNQKCLLGVINTPCHTTEMRCAISVCGLKPHPDIKKLWCSIIKQICLALVLFSTHLNQKEERKKKHFNTYKTTNWSIHLKVYAGRDGQSMDWYKLLLWLQGFSTRNLTCLRKPYESNNLYK